MVQFAHFFQCDSADAKIRIVGKSPQGALQRRIMGRRAHPAFDRRRTNVVVERRIDMAFEQRRQGLIFKLGKPFQRAVANDIVVT